MPEVLELYREAFLTDRKTSRGHRLRERQLALLQRLERAAAVQPQAGDLVSGWFDDRTADKLIAANGRWYHTLPAVGTAKAHHIAQHLATLLPAAARPVRPVFVLAAIDLPAPASAAEKLCNNALFIYKNIFLFIDLVVVYLGAILETRYPTNMSLQLVLFSIFLF